jgi:hypothetical protein
MPEEFGAPYAVHPGDIIHGAQFNADYLALNPNNKVPTIVDEAGHAANRSQYSRPARSSYTPCDLLNFRSCLFELTACPSDPRHDLFARSAE